MSVIKEFIKSIPVVGPAVRKIYNAVTVPDVPQPSFTGSRTYWEERYQKGGNSGVGSYGKFAEFKAEVLNSFVRDNNIDHVIEFGCGDGNQLTLAEYPRYTGFDVSGTAVSQCRDLFAGDAAKEFLLLEEFTDRTADLTLSLDVIYHLVEDDIFENYMHQLFDAATRFVIIYASDTDENKGYENTHVWHRKFTAWIEENIPGWSLKQKIPNKHPYDGDYTQGSFADFYIYQKVG